MPRLDACSVGGHQHLHPGPRQITRLTPGTWVWVEVPFEDVGWVVVAGVEKAEDDNNPDMVWLLTSQGDRILYNRFSVVTCRPPCDGSHW